MMDKTWAQVFKDAVISLPVIPTAILFGLLLFAFVIIAKAQQRTDFDWADMLKDESGKVSSARMFSFICLALTSWVIAVLTISDRLTSEYFWYYLIVWSGTAVALKLVDKWDGNLPLARGNAPRPGTVTSTTTATTVAVSPTPPPPPPLDPNA